MYSSERRSSRTRILGIGVSGYQWRITGGQNMKSFGLEVTKTLLDF
jgi:hypothetical protein